MDIPTARLDALVLLCHVLQKDKSYILAYDDALLKAEELNKLTNVLHRRLQHEPIAYIIGKKEFYGRDFTVNPNVLIPRPESENFIELLKKYPPQNNQSLVDIGTGSGILAITAKKEFPTLNVYATDISTAAIAVARQNAQLLQANIRFIQSDLFLGVEGTFDYIFANLPYVPAGFITSKEITKEPAVALFSGVDGLDCIRTGVDQLMAHCAKSAYVCLESLRSQHNNVVRLCAEQGLVHIETIGLVQLYQAPPSRLKATS